jgi:hypothetical protein
MFRMTSKRGPDEYGMVELDVMLEGQLPIDHSIQGSRLGDRSAAAWHAAAMRLTHTLREVRLLAREAAPESVEKIEQAIDGALADTNLG